MLMHPASGAAPVLLLGESSVSGDYESRRVHSAGRRLCGYGKHKIYEMYVRSSAHNNL